MGKRTDQQAAWCGPVGEMLGALVQARAARLGGTAGPFIVAGAIIADDQSCIVGETARFISHDGRPLPMLAILPAPNAVLTALDEA